MWGAGPLRCALAAQAFLSGMRSGIDLSDAESAQLL